MQVARGNPQKGGDKYEFKKLTSSLLLIESDLAHI